MNHTAKLDGTHICNATMKLAVLLMPQMCYLLHVYWPWPSVCLFLTAFLHYCTDPDVTWVMVEGAL